LHPSGRKLLYLVLHAPVHTSGIVTSLGFCVSQGIAGTDQGPPAKLHAAAIGQVRVASRGGAQGVRGKLKFCLAKQLHALCSAMACICEVTQVWLIILTTKKGGSEVKRPSLLFTESRRGTGFEAAGSRRVSAAKCPGDGAGDERPQCQPLQRSGKGSSRSGDIHWQEYGSAPCQYYPHRALINCHVHCRIHRVAQGHLMAPCPGHQLHGRHRRLQVCDRAHGCAVEGAVRSAAMLQVLGAEVCREAMRSWQCAEGQPWAGKTDSSRGLPLTWTWGHSLKGSFVEQSQRRQLLTGCWPTAGF
jgi:hypothetical protein